MQSGPDKAADLCIISTSICRASRCTIPIPSGHAMSSHQIRDVMVAGKIVVNEYRPVFGDVAQLLDRASYWKEKIVSEIGL